MTVRTLHSSFGRTEGQSLILDPRELSTFVDPVYFGPHKKKASLVAFRRYAARRAANLDGQGCLSARIVAPTLLLHRGCPTAPRSLEMAGSKCGKLGNKGQKVGFGAGRPCPTAGKSEPHHEPLYRQNLLGAAFEAEVPWASFLPISPLRGLCRTWVHEGSKGEPRGPPYTGPTSAGTAWCHRGSCGNGCPP